MNYFKANINWVKSVGNDTKETEVMLKKTNSVKIKMYFWRRKKIGANVSDKQLFLG